MKKISLVINADTRNENSNADTMFNGTVNLDFITDGVIQKKKFFEGFELETILYIDIHNPLEQKTIDYLSKIVDVLVLRKHTDEPSFNCWNYHRALSLAKGDIIIHCDQDTNLYREDKSYVDELISCLEKHKCVSYPSHWTPNPCHDESFNNQWWWSTRFFICKKEDLKLDEVAKSITNPNWMYEKYGDSVRRVNWFEHYISKVNGNEVFYPPVELHKGAIFSWKTYDKYTIQRLNEMPYEYIKQWILHRGGIQYPVDVKCE